MNFVQSKHGGITIGQRTSHNSIVGAAKGGPGPGHYQISLGGGNGYTFASKTGGMLNNKNSIDQPGPGSYNTRGNIGS